MHKSFAISDTDLLKQKVLSWLNPFSTFCFLDSNNYPGQYDLLVGAGSLAVFQSSGNDALAAFQAFVDQEKRWLFGHLGYELATTESGQRTTREDRLGFPDLFFFEPEIILCLQQGALEVHGADPDKIFTAISNAPPVRHAQASRGNKIESSLSREAYLAIQERLKYHLQRGDCYEINFCQEFFVEQARLDPFYVFSRLKEKSPVPFCGLYRIHDKWLLCASPERFIQKTGNRITSQPIKGTLQRKTLSADVQAEQLQLSESAKDRAENVMIVDLVRNDLSKICKNGSVQVDELFGIYSFPQVHQMISTISGTLREEINFKNIIDATFPMGSMTGAPKVKVMQLIDRYEKSKRGIFSGALGYLHPDGDFDFNVVIRSIMYNASEQYASFQAGGGITIYSDAEKEWEESLLKAQALKEVLTS